MKKSETLVVLGSGPSLRGFDFRRLRRFDVIGMNVAYRHWDEIGWYPKYYICLDSAVGVSHKQEIARLIRETEQNGIKVFILRRDLIELLPDDIRDKGSILDFDALAKTIPIFKKTQPITTGSHATIIGAMFGYRQMFLLGVDCNYVERVEGAIEQDGSILKIEKTPPQNPNYFFDRYQVAGDKYHTPNSAPDLHLKAWDVADRVLGEHGIEVWNGSPISAVKNFPYHDFSDLEKKANFLFQWYEAVKDLRVSSVLSSARSKAERVQQEQSDVA